MPGTDKTLAQRFLWLNRVQNLHGAVCCYLLSWNVDMLFIAWNQAPESILNYLDIFCNIISVSFQALAKVARVGPWKVTCNYKIFIKCIRKAKNIVFIYGKKVYGNKEINIQLQSPKCNLFQINSFSVGNIRNNLFPKHVL